MVIRTIANQVGTIEVDGNSLYFLQPLSAFETDEMDKIQQAYEKRMGQLQEKKQYLAAKDLTFQSGQVQFEYELFGFKAFDSLKSIFFEDKLPYYLSLIQIAKDTDVNVLWQKENFVMDPVEKELKAMVLENDVLQIQNPKNRLDAIKELIIVTLTNLNRVLGRPKRSDFFEQSEEVIRFAEMIYLRLTTLEEMEAYIIQVHREVIERRRVEEEALQLQNVAKKRFSFSKAVNYTRALAGKDNIHPTKLSKGRQKNKKNAPNAKENNIRFLLGAGLILLLAVLVNVVLTSANKHAQANETNEPAIQDEINLEETYRLGLLGNEEAVIEALESVPYTSLDKEDQEVLNKLYLENEEYQKLVENKPEAAAEVAAILAEKNDVEQLKEFQSSLPKSDPAVDFEVALASRDWQQVINLRNQVELTDMRLTRIVTAFIQTNDLQAAKAFVNEKAADDEKLLNQILEAEKLHNELDILKAEKAEQQKVIDTDSDKKKINSAKDRMKEIDKRIDELSKALQKG